uniref:Uncharacterized protein n=1 Tax=Parascaris equorum TaxID=6256 RepID=A0A914RT08_PAREQ
MRRVCHDFHSTDRRTGKRMKRRTAEGLSQMEQPNGTTSSELCNTHSAYVQALTYRKATSLICVKFLTNISAFILAFHQILGYQNLLSFDMALTSFTYL